MSTILSILSILNLFRFASATLAAQTFNLNDALTLQKICSAATEAHLSAQCREQLAESCSNETILDLMIDAESKFPYAGLNFAKRMDLGNFDECIRIKHQYRNGSILGKYCTNGLVLYNLLDAFKKRVNFDLATCIPNGCSATDYNNIFQVIYSNNFTGIFYDDFCTTNEPKKLTIAAQAIISVFAIAIILMVISTGYDYYLVLSKKRCQYKLLIAFSIMTNGRNMLRTTGDKKGQVLIFAGFRLISTICITVSHTDALWKVSPIMNLIDFERMPTHWYSFYTYGSIPIVDTFFYMSGFLVTYQFLKNKDRSLKEHVLSIPRFCLHRFLRIAPAVYMVYFVMIYLLEYIANGPLAAMGCQSVRDGCKRQWSFFLFLENYYNGKYCLFHVWYLSVDMQLYILSPLILIPLAMRLKSGETLRSSLFYMLVFNIIMFSVSVATVFIFHKHDNYSDSHPRAVVFIIGMMMATYMRERPGQKFLWEDLSMNAKRVINLIAWVIVLCLLYLCLWMTVYWYFNNAEINKYSLCNVLIKPIWGVSLCWIVYSCHHGYGGFANWILTRPFMQIGSKLSYSMYVVQIIPIYMHYNTIRNKIYVSDITLNINFWGFFMFITLLAYFWNLAFEMPIAIVEKVILDSVPNERVKEPKGNNEVTSEISTKL